MSFAGTSTELSWHSAIWDKFLNARTSKHLPHALLLTGAKGTGKTLLAEKMIKSLLCLEPVIGQACNSCNACKTYCSGANPDYMEIKLLEGKQQIGVNQIRELSEFLNYSRSFSAYRVILLNPIERMNKNAANSLLKSLEEPSDNTILILIATNLSAVIPTIRSRCQLLTIPMPSRREAMEWLNSHSEESENNEEFLALANGSPLVACKMSLDELKLKRELYDDLLKIIDDRKPVTEIAKKWEKADQEKILNWQILIVEGLIKHQYQPSMSNKSSDISPFSSKLPVDKQWLLLTALIQKKQIIHTSVNPLINLESMLILWQQAVKS